MKADRIFLAALFTAISIIVPAQNRRTETVVLNDGTMIAGKILSDTSGYLVLKVKKPQVLVLKKSQVLATGRPSLIYRTDKHGYFINLSASVLAGHGSDGNSGHMSIKLSNGYQLKNGLSFGFGTGIEELDLFLVPVYADIRYHPFTTRVSPYIRVSSGYGIPCSNRRSMYDYYRETDGGIMFNAGSGITLYSWNRSAVNIEIGYRYQRLSSETYSAWRNTTTELVTNFNRIEIQFGFIFR